MTLLKSVWVLWKPSPSLRTTSCRSIGVEYWKINPNGRRIWRKFVRLCLSSSRHFHVNLPRQLSIPSPSRKFRAFCKWPVDELTVYRLPRSLPRIIVPPPLSPSSLPFIPSLSSSSAMRFSKTYQWRFKLWKLIIFDVIIFWFNRKI